MARWHVHVVHMRARDIRVGDVVARDPSKFDGWFRVHEIRQLGTGTYNILDKSNSLSFTVGPFDLVGLQTPVQLPAEAERNAHGAESGHPQAQASPTATAPQPNASGAAPSADPETPHGGAESTPQAAPTSAASRREAAAREALARGESGGGARALPGA